MAAVVVAAAMEDVGDGDAGEEGGLPEEVRVSDYIEATFGRAPLRVDTERDADLERQELRTFDRELMRVYGDTIHSNDGRHLTGGVVDNE